MSAAFAVNDNLFMPENKNKQRFILKTYLAGKKKSV
jgi:hypothetical protein